jgi:undecaprenyl-phosphate 4-deoxy-4-formamido-L-arabinose transferase
MISISIVIPVYSGADYLSKLMGEIEDLRATFTGSKASFDITEVILVDDAAIDGSPQLIDELSQQYEWVSAIHLSRNFGQHPATMAGILHTSGDWVVTLDEDLQHPPSRIPALLQEVAKTGADIVYGSAAGAVHHTMMRDFTSRNYKRIIERLTGNQSIHKVSSFRLIRGSIARAASGVCSHDTYYDVALAWFTQRIEILAMELYDERFATSGKSGYNFKSLLSHARRMAFSSQIKLLRTGALLGFMIVSLSFIAGIILILLGTFASHYIAAPGWTSLMLAICFFSGITMLLAGISLEYISILVMRAHGKPIFFTINREDDALLVDYFDDRE